ncbi:PTS sugar transporter subunit IIB [Lactobacillus sp. ESL0791]|uniref:PTS system mannose/fructose/N-acetylgalactosamine-transporter subunit IIB n=1 Tax=Lactobacillus sp. ESL0791 TaxID=2983234 RepID=UPI0023FA13E7|nr:PTS sugar transporter subunit IIB [Lactobacillus sp. ESL0791]MDF7639368.1 PTS sugar transporter subunit IIB [Lactobacillus sp. ESL0791]
MNIVGARVDQRLVHGQVANLWTPNLQVERIIVVDDDASKSDIQKSGLRMATPMTTRLSVLTADVAADHLNNERYGKQRLFIVAKRPERFLDLIDRGVKIETVNVGNMPKGDDTTALTKQVSVNQADVEVFKQLIDKGVKLTVQLTPRDDSHDLMKLIDEKMK